jgi:hypothetical protein
MAGNLDDLTLGEIDTIENFTGQALGALAGEDKPQGRFLIAMCTVIKKRSDPTFTFEDATKLRMSEVQEIIGTGEDNSAGE